MYRLHRKVIVSPADGICGLGDQQLVGQCGKTSQAIHTKYTNFLLLRKLSRYDYKGFELSILKTVSKCLRKAAVVAPLNKLTWTPPG